MSRTDKTRPFRVKMLDSKSNYKEVHNHASRSLRVDGKTVRVPVEGKMFGGRQVVRTILVDHPECDLPENPWDEDNRPDQWSSCHWTYTRAWIATGEARCGCPQCSDTVGRKQMTRKERRNNKRAARNWKDEY